MKRLTATGILVLVLSLLAWFLPGCGIKNRETLTQLSTVDALLAGIYDGTTTCKELKNYGDFGLGTFEAVDGEMVVLDGKIYQVKSDGVAYAAPDSLIVPFAAVTFFDKDIEADIPSGLDFKGLEKILDQSIPENTFCAIRVHARFAYMKTRSVPAQSRPYPLLAEVTKNQSVFEFNDIEGTLVGFRSPPFVNGVNVPGYHLHFLTEDRQAGGHILELKTSTSTALLDFTPEFYMVLPEPESDFYKVDFSGDRSQELQKVEK